MFSVAVIPAALAVLACRGSSGAPRSPSMASPCSGCWPIWRALMGKVNRHGQRGDHTSVPKPCHDLKRVLVTLTTACPRGRAMVYADLCKRR